MPQPPASSRRRIIAALANVANVANVRRPLSGMRNKITAFALAAVGGLALAQAVPLGTVADIDERTRPFGELCRKGEDCGSTGTAGVVPEPAAAGRSGEQVYQAHCHICHATGLNDAPKLADAEAWATRLAKGAEALLKVTKEGLNTMPPMGTCMNCTDAELRAAIDYMTAPAAE